MLQVRLAALLGASGILCAAWGAHGLERYAVEGGLRWWAIGAVLHLVTAPAALALSHFESSSPRSFSTALFGIGVLLFSGTLYAMALGAPRWLGAVTPLGGLCLLAAWIGTAFCTRATPTRTGRR